jgi:hypothetical protein
MRREECTADESWKRGGHLENQEEDQQRDGGVNDYIHEVKARRMAVPQPPCEREAREREGSIEARPVHHLRPVGSR